MIKRSLISFDAANFGEHKWKLVVLCQFGPIKWTRVYYACGGFRVYGDTAVSAIDWRDKSGVLMMSRTLTHDLDMLLKRALAYAR